jgi:hypothetical protein
MLHAHQIQNPRSIFSHDLGIIHCSDELIGSIIIALWKSYLVNSFSFDSNHYFYWSKYFSWQNLDQIDNFKAKATVAILLIYGLVWFLSMLVQQYLADVIVVQ